MDDRLPRSAYFYLNNTIDLREDKIVEEPIIDNEEKKKSDKDSDKKKEVVPDKANTKATKADTATLIHKNNKQMELLNRQRLLVQHIKNL